MTLPGCLFVAQFTRRGSRNLFLASQIKPWPPCFPAPYDRGAITSCSENDGMSCIFYYIFGFYIFGEIVSADLCSHDVLLQHTLCVEVDINVRQRLTTQRSCSSRPSQWFLLQL